MYYLLYKEMTFLETEHFQTMLHLQFTLFRRVGYKNYVKTANNASFSYQDTPPTWLRSLLVCILNIDNKTSKSFSKCNHLFEDIWEKQILYINQGPKLC